jgi:hypothetical protein
MSNTPLNILLVRNNPYDARSTCELLLESSSLFSLECVEWPAGGLSCIGVDGFDALLLDLEPHRGAAV